MSDYSTAVQTDFEPCPDPWAKLHVFYNHETKQVIAARCKRWTCFACAKINYYKVDHLISLGNPERFITLSRAGRTPKEINYNLKKLVQGIRRLGLVFEYAAVVELHLNGHAHLHLMQRGDFIEQALLSEMWKKYTAKSYQGGSCIVDIRRIDPNQNVKGYLLKYLKKTWELEAQNPKSWHALQAAYPGLNHYRMSRNWLANRPEKSTDWQLVPKVLVCVQDVVLDPVDELFFTNCVDPLTPIQALAVQSRKKLSRA
jgi:hypothetical protein